MIPILGTGHSITLIYCSVHRIAPSFHTADAINLIFVLYMKFLILFCKGRAITRVFGTVYEITPISELNMKFPLFSVL